ncbi:hypothetical protein KI387_003108, partial [Taxus chinensis]
MLMRWLLDGTTGECSRWKRCFQSLRPRGKGEVFAVEARDQWNGPLVRSCSAPWPRVLLGEGEAGATGK